MLKKCLRDAKNGSEGVAMQIKPGKQSAKQTGPVIAVSGVVLALLVGAMARAQSPSVEELRARAALEAESKATVMKLFKEGASSEEILALLDPDYIQHDPVAKRFAEIHGVHGNQEFVELVKARKAGIDTSIFAPPKGPAGKRAYKVMVDGDLVTVIQQRFLPDPQKPGSFYEGFWYDTWRVKHGRLAEHWDPMTIPNAVPDLLKPLDARGGPTATSR